MDHWTQTQIQTIAAAIVAKHQADAPARPAQPTKTDRRSIIIPFPTRSTVGQLIRLFDRTSPAPEAA